jgi:hypothetical protein
MVVHGDYTIGDGLQRLARESPCPLTKPALTRGSIPKYYLLSNTTGPCMSLATKLATKLASIHSCPAKALTPRRMSMSAAQPPCKMIGPSALSPENGRGPPVKRHMSPLMGSTRFTPSKVSAVHDMFEKYVY